MRLPIITLFGFSLLLGSFVSQATVIYDESLSGDLATFDTIALDLSAGTNSVIGSSAYTNSIYDFDGFQISLGTGLILTSVEYFINNLSVSSNTSFLTTSYSLRSGSHTGSTLAYTTINLLGSSPQSMFGSALPLFGNLSLATSPTSLGRSGNGGTWDYEFRFTVASVPEPSTLSMIALGLLGLGFSRKQFKQSDHQQSLGRCQGTCRLNESSKLLS